MVQTVYLFNAIIAFIDWAIARKRKAQVALTFFVVAEICAASGLPEVRDTLIVYAILTGVWALGAKASKKSDLAAYICLWFDVALSLLCVYAGAPYIPFLLLLFFVISLITLRWSTVYALALTGILASSYALHIGWIIFAPSYATVREEQLSQALGQWVVVSCLVMFSCMAVSHVFEERRRSRARRAKLVEWSSQARSWHGSSALAQCLRHAAAIMHVHRVLVVYDVANEPVRKIILWTEGKIEVWEERGDMFGDLVAAHLSDSAFATSAEHRSWWCAIRNNISLLDRDLQRTFQVKSAATAPFAGATFSGRVFVLDNPQLTREDVTLTKLIASQVGAAIEAQLLHSELEVSIADRERCRLARDLHDGLLQGLAAANIHLSIVSQRQNDELDPHVKKAQDIIDREVGRLRAVVNEARSPLTAESRTVRLSSELTQYTEYLAHQWECRIDFESETEDFVTSAFLSQNIHHIIMEAVSNAVRHGGASQVRIKVRHLRNCLTLLIRDTGSGFRNLQGTYSIDELKGRDAAPHSLCSRIRDLGGTLSLTSTRNGTGLRIEIPA